MPGDGDNFGSVLFKDFYPDKDAFIVEQLKNAGASDFGKGDSGRARWRRYAWFAVRIDKKSLRIGANGRRLVGRIRGERLGKPRRSGRRPRRAGIDTPAVNVELYSRDADQRRTGEPRRRVFRLAAEKRLARTHGPHGQRPRDTAGRHRRL